MSRYIDADRLCEVLERNFGHTGGVSILKQLIDAQPTVDVVEVPVRCRDCAYYIEREGYDREMIKKFINHFKRPKCRNDYRCHDCIHCKHMWEGIVFRGFYCKINAR